jgi:hypothetical protein
MVRHIFSVSTLHIFSVLEHHSSPLHRDAKLTEGGEHWQACRRGVCGRHPRHGADHAHELHRRRGVHAVDGGGPQLLAAPRLGAGAAHARCAVNTRVTDETCLYGEF